MATFYTQVALPLIPRTDNTPLDVRTKVETISDISNIKKPYEGLLFYVTETETVYKVTKIAYDENIGSYIPSDGYESITGGTSLTFANVRPEDINTIWVDGSDEQLNDETLFDRISEILNGLDSRISNIEYAFNVTMDSGDTSFYANSELETANAVEPGTEGSESADNASVEPVWADDLQPNVKHICIKKATNAIALEEYRKHAMYGELIYSVTDNKLYIGTGGNLREISGGSGGSSGGSTNVTSNYVDLIATDNPSVTYRITVNSNGELIVRNRALYDESNVTPVAGFNQQGLVISMAYALPRVASATPSCSHSYVELYNATSSEINLSGHSLCVGTSTWEYTIPLYGRIPAGGNFLIRLNAATNTSSAAVQINNFDVDAYKDCNAAIYADGFKLYLQVGTTKPSTDNLYNTLGNNVADGVTGYIDLVSAVGEGLATNITSGESNTKYSITDNKRLTANRGIYRNYIDTKTVNGVKVAGTGDSNINYNDFRSFDYTSDNSALTDRYIGNVTTMFKPRTSADGATNMYRFRSKLDNTKPNMPTICIGENGVTRTFTWNSTVSVTTNDYLFIKMANASTWTCIEANTDSNYIGPYVANETGSQYTEDSGQIFKVHKVIVDDLIPGADYVWCCGPKTSTNEPRTTGSYICSDEFTFTVSAVSNDRSGEFSFCLISDQQGWAFNEYDPWAIAIKEIVKNHNNNNATKFPYGEGGIEFFLNTGDMSQNGSRVAEWLDYYNGAKNYFPHVPQMNCVGNNDLCNKGTTPKILPTSFEYYYTYQYSSDATANAAQQLNDGTYMKSTYSFDYGCVHFVCLNSNGYDSEVGTLGNYIQEQKNWFIADMEAVAARDVQPKWIIVYMHDAPFNCVTKSPDSLRADLQMDLTTAFNGVAGLRDSGINQRGDVDNRFTWSRLLEQYKVDLVLSGHKHTYSRSHMLKESVLDPSIAENSTLNPLGLDINPWAPEITENTSTITESVNGTSVNTTVYTGSASGNNYNGPIYVMCQATGYKLQSNKDVPADIIRWLGKYFPGQANASDKWESSADQKNPTYIMWDVEQNLISMTAYQLTHITDGTLWDHMINGDKGKTWFGNDGITVAPETIIIDRIKLIKE